MSVRILEEGEALYRFEEGDRLWTYPRVTACLGVLWPNRPKSDPALIRGRHVHKAVALLNGGLDGSGLDWDSIVPEYRPYLSAWGDFQQVSGFEPIALNASGPVAVELFIWSHGRRFAGRLDAVCRLPKLKAPLGDPRGLWIVDVKTAEETWEGEGPQTAAYELGYHEVTGYRGRIRRLSVHLHHTGKFSTEEWTDPADLSTFLCAHHVYSWWQRHGRAA